MADNESTVKLRADIASLKAGMQAAARQVRLANSEFKAATAGMDNWNQSATGLQAKLKQLDSTLKAQKKQVEMANEEYEKTVQLYGKNSAEADRAKMKLNGYEAAVKKTEKEVDQYNDELKKAEQYGDNYADTLDDMEDAQQKASEGFTVMKGALASLVADGIRMAISAMKDLAKETIQAGMNFESAMSEVGAISGASAEEMEQLTAKAKEMGAQTKFSATESAEAFNYMAMAGWKTEDMINGIEGVMSLAAASGEDLATTSDIVTDALTAMGYSAGDAGQLADVMAAASSNANTNVSLMGKTFQYAAPIVGAMGYSMEDVAVAIGLMANAGIKGDKAGTALRSTLTRLAAPPKECADAMEELGISLTDSEGKMKPFSQVMEDLRGAFDGLSETQQTQYAKAIAGQEAMSGLLAIVNAAPADFDKLTKAVAESNGAAQEMSETMQDNLAGDITLLKSKIEGIMIKVFEKMSDSLRKSVGEMSDALDKIDWDAWGEKAGKMAEKLVDWLIKIVDNADGIVSVLKAVGTVLAATFVVTKVASFAQSIIGLYKTFVALKTATEAATTSQLLLNAAQAATPIGLVTAAVAGLAAGIVYLASKNAEAGESYEALTEYEEEQIEKIAEMKQAYEELKVARDENVQAINAEYSHYGELASELDGLVDANGRVKAGYEDRVNFILTTLNEAVGTEMELVDGVIQNYKDEKTAIDNLIQSKKAEAILSANEEAYTTAIQNKKEALQNLSTAQGIFAQNQADLTKAQEKYNEVMNMTASEYMDTHGLYDYTTASQMLAAEQEEVANKLTAAKVALGESRVAMGNAQQTYDSYMSTIQNYEGLSAAIISGDADKIGQALANMEYDFMTAETATKKSLENQVTNYEENLEALKQAIENGTPGVTQEMVDQAEEMVKKAKAELDKAPDEFSKSANDASKKYGDTLGSTANQNYVKGKAQLVLEAGNQGLKPNGNEKTSGENLTKGFAGGISAQEILAKNAASKIGTGSVDSLNTSIDAHSPSRKTTTSGENFGQGFINGMENKKNSIWDKAKSLAQKAIAALKKGQEEGSPSKITYQSGVYFVQGYINGIVSQQGKLQTTIKSMVTTVITELAKMNNYNFDTVGENASNAFGDAITKKFNYTLNKMQYENEQKLAEFDANVEKLSTQETKASKKLQTASDKKVKQIESNRDKKVKKLQAQIDKLGNSDADKKKKKQLQKEISSTKESAKKKISAEKASVKKRIEASKKDYQKLINNEKENKEAYQKASSEMISEYSSAMNEYQTKAQDLIDSTINGITDRYNERYDELINKQDTLIDKLKNAGDLFGISGAGVMTVNDLQEQTKAIKEYTGKLQKIKEKVSSELFDQIASYDMQEGSAFMDRLLVMSASDLEAYNKAYTEKMEAAQQAGESIYKSDFDKIASDYQNEIDKAFKDLPKQLEELGNDAMQGFLSGLTENTDYMSDTIKTYIKAMVNTFKDELKIKSPSRVMMELGDYAGAGFVNGLKSTINSVKKTASNMAKEAAVPLDEMKTSLGQAKSIANDKNGIGQTTNNVTNNYNLVQNNTSPKSLSALETYQARRQQIALIKAFT